MSYIRVSLSQIFKYFSAVNVTCVSFSPVFQYFVAYVRMYAMRHGIVLSAMDSSIFNSSAMDSSAIGVAVLVGKFMQGPCSAVPDIRSIYQRVRKLS